MNKKCLLEKEFTRGEDCGEIYLRGENRKASLSKKKSNI